MSTPHIELLVDGVGLSPRQPVDQHYDRLSINPFSPDGTRVLLPFKDCKRPIKGIFLFLFFFEVGFWKELKTVILLLAVRAP